MESINQVIDIVRPNVYMTSINLKDAFYECNKIAKRICKNKCSTHSRKRIFRQTKILESFKMQLNGS